MQNNVGGMDKNIRMGAGAVLLVLSILGMVHPGWLFGLVGVVLLATGFLGFCPAYLPFGINTCKK